MVTIKSLNQTLINQLSQINGLGFDPTTFKYTDLNDTELPFITLAAVLQAFTSNLTSNDTVLLYAMHYEKTISVDCKAGYDPEDLEPIINLNIPELGYNLQLIWD